MNSGIVKKVMMYHIKKRKTSKLVNILIQKFKDIVREIKL